MSLAVSHCPDCNKRLATTDSRAHTHYGFPTIRRRRACGYCDYKITTIELPIDIGNSVFAED